MVKVIDCDIRGSEFKPHSRYYVYFRTNTSEKGMRPPIPPQLKFK